MTDAVSKHGQGCEDQGSSVNHLATVVPLTARRAHGHATQGNGDLGSRHKASPVTGLSPARQHAHYHRSEQAPHFYRQHASSSTAQRIFARAAAPCHPLSARLLSQYPPPHATAPNRARIRLL